MPSRANAIELNLSALESAENRAARQVAAAYNQARRELLDAILSAWGQNRVLDGRDAVRLLQRLAILQQVDGRLLQLERQLGVILRDIVVSQDEIALTALQRELALLPADIRPNVAQFATVDTALVEEFLPIALDDVQLGTGALRATLRRELQSGLIQGESFPNLVARLMATSEPSTWRNGALSAERMTRRLVITANNAAKNAYLTRAREELPDIRKQAVASISSRTTDTCIRVHGQIQDVDRPFVLTGEPKFAREMMHPAFHWNCRTAETMWHPAFERSGLTTANMRSSAEAELKRRS